MVLACTCRVPCPCPLSEVISWQSIDRAPTGSEDTSASRTGSGPVNLATIRAAVTAALKDAGYLHVPEGRRDHTTPAETLRLHGLD